MNRYLIPMNPNRHSPTGFARGYLLLIAALMLASVSMVACGQKAPHSDIDVMASFSGIAKAQTLPARQNIWDSWSNQIILGKVKYIEKSIYEVYFPNMQLSGVEVWRIDMEASKIWPENSGALMLAFALFCNDRNDQTGDCKSYVRLLDGLKQSLDK